MEEKEFNSNCPRCNTVFTCLKNNVSDCFCASIHLSDKNTALIKTTFKGCLCESCLKSFSDVRPVLPITALTTLFILFSTLCFGQFHTAAGTASTSAIHKDSSAFVSWAKTCTVTRGWQDIANITLGVTNVGVDENGTLKAGDNPVVSLGDGGYAILTFSNTIKNGLGYDFAVFENSFSDTFLELAFVEVSSDGINYFRFPATCNLSTTLQIGPFDQTSDPSKINNLAGKYRINYGTPFDLEELKNSIGLNVDAITHIKIIDVVGSINNAFSRYDKNNSVINDPYPTGFGNGGFDLDAVGVIHQNPVGIEELYNAINFNLFPNPCSDKLFINTASETEIYASLCDATGMQIYNEISLSPSHTIDVSHLPEGIYFITLKSSRAICKKKVIIAR